MSAVLKHAVSASPISADAAARRYNIYTIVHKALRAFMTDTLQKIGRMDPADDGECAAAVAQLRHLLSMCTSHLEHENEFVHTAIERAFPGRAARTAAEHEQHETEIAALRQDIARLESTPAEQRPQAVHALYLHLSGFVAENLIHMNVEETQNHAALVAAYDDSEVMAIEHALVASLSPQEKFATLSWMIPYANASERAYLLGGMQRNAPPEAFQAALGLARDNLSQRDFFKLERALA